MDPNKMISAKDSWKSISLLAYQSLGVVYGDLSISPLYVFKSTFTEDVGHSKTNEEIYGVLSFLFWSLTLIPLFKYVFIVLRADDNGEGGTFGLYSLICRHANISLLPSRQFSDEDLSTYKLRLPPIMKNTSSIKIWLEKHKNLHTALLVVVMIGTCMVIGDGIVTPALSVFSAVSGLEASESKVVRHEYTVVTITCFLLVCLFALQNHGTHRVGHIFAPIILVWLLCISAIGIYNIIHWNHHVYKAVSPYYMLKFLKKTKTSVWNTLGGILLCITGSEAMFADLGHFSYTAIQVAFTFLVYPALILSYMGQAAYLSKNHDGYISVHIGFYDSVPGVIWIPVSIIAILASVVGSQAVISGTFSIIKQSQSLGCFPRIKVVHTSDKIHGQIYIPEINWMLMVLSIAVVVGFRDTRHMGNASGLAEMTVMLVTTFLTSIVMILCWSKPPLVALAFLLFFGSIEALYFSASLTKFLEGAWFPVLLGLFLVMIMFIWHYTTIKKYEFNLQNKLSLEWLLTLDDNLGVVRVPGIGIVFTDLISGVPATFSHFVTNLPAFHRILVFVCVKSVPVPFVPPAERYLVGRVGPPIHRSYRCIVRYGYRDAQDVDMFESDLVSCLADFVRFEAASSDHWTSKSPDGHEQGLTVMGSSMFPGNRDKDMEESNPAPCSVSREVPKEDTAIELAPVGPGGKRVRFLIEGDIDEGGGDKGVRQELEELWAASECGITFIMGHSHVRAKPRSSTMKKATVNLGYGFLRRICRGPDVALRVPAASMLEVGIVCVV